MPASEELVIPAFSKVRFLNHEHLEEIFNKNSGFFKFLPDQISFERIPKRVLFTVTNKLTIR